MNLSNDKNNVILFEVNKLFALVTKALKKIGHSELEYVLKNLVIEGEFEEKKYNILIDFIIDLVVEEWQEHKIKRKDLFQYTKRGEVTIARKLAIILIKENIEDISDQKLSTYFGDRCRQVVYGIMKDYTKMDMKDRFDSAFLEKHKKLSQKVADFIKSSELPSKKSTKKSKNI